MTRLTEWCIHYRGLYGAGGVTHETCSIGVVYESVKVADAPTFSVSLPCLCEAVKTCGMQRFRTPEESAAHEREIAERMEFTGAARMA